MASDSTTVSPVRPPQRILMAPGPTELPPTVIQALIAPLTGHKDPFFLSVMDDTARLLRQVFQTRNRTCLSLPGTGGAGMEAALTNLIQPGDTAVVCINGLFGERMAEIVRRCGGKAVTVTAPWGEPVDPDDVRRALRAERARVVMATHGETSTGIQQPLDEIGQAAREHDAMLVVDTVATLGGIRVVPDQWNCAICFSASQKCLSAPPGLAPITVSDDAMAYIRGRATPVQNWYFDLDFHDRYWFAEERAYHHTAPVLLTYALREAVRLVVEEGLDDRFARHKLHQKALTAGISALELDLFGNPTFRLPTVVAVRTPDAVDEARVRAELLNEFGVEIAGGLGAQAGKIWRIGVMGYSATQDNILLLLAGIETLLARQGYGNDTGAAVAAASSVYSAARGAAAAVAHTP
ncbi:MAG TPA: alanine--glyoxylate aminotransferase family protein [Chloroflexota bacterium]|nr:alanine--glyoxylate aminotransferase family protein [Chloroflexota bacterium]